MTSLLADGLHVSTDTLVVIALVLFILIAILWLIGHRPWR